MDLRRNRHTLRWKYILFIFIFLGFAQLLPGQETDCVGFHLSDLNAEKGDQICVDVAVENFDTIAAFQFAINFNPNVIQFNTCLDPNVLNFFECGNSIVDLRAQEGILNLLWFDLNTDGVTLPDQTIIFQLCFDVVGDCGQTTPILISDIGIGTTGIVRCDENGICTEDENICQTGGDIKIISSEFDFQYSFCSAQDGSNTGSIQFATCGGLPPYNYTFNGVNGTLENDFDKIQFANLTPGSYPIEVIDSNGDTIRDIVDLVANDPLSLSYEAVGPTCATSLFPNGYITLMPAGGGGDYRYNWSNTPANLSTFSNLSNGEYSVTVVDSYGCEISEEISVLTDTLKVEVIVEDAPCTGRGGTLLITASGGKPFPGGGYNIAAELPDGINFNPPPDTTLSLINVAPGTVRYRVIDGSVGNQCRVEGEIEVGIETELELNIMTKNLSCIGTDDGQVTISVENSDSDLFSFILMDKNGIPQQGVSDQASNSYSFTQLKADSFYISVEDGNRCEILDSFSIFEPLPLSWDTPVITNPGCFGSGANGVIEVNAIGGTGILSYSWDDGGTGSGRSGLSEGSYFVTVSDENLCLDSMSIDLIQVGSLQPDSIIVKDISCPGINDGSISIHFSPGTNGVTVNWGDGPVVETFQTGLDTGLYMIGIADLNGCFIDTSIQINSPIALEATFTQDGPECAGGLANLGISASGGTGPGTYTYLWSENSSTASTLVQIPSGVYSVEVTDENGCIQNFSYTLTDPDKIGLEVSQINSTLCYGDSTGSALATASGGFPLSGNYVYTWSSGESDLMGVHTATQLPSGMQWAIASDGICASDTLFFNVSNPELIMLDTLSTSFVQPSCFGSNDGQISVTGIGGTGTLSYEWTALGIQGSQIQNLVADKYELKITDTNGCSVIDSLTLGQPDSLIASIDSTATVDLNCFGEDSGQITVLHEGGNQGSFSFVWTNGVSDAETATDLGLGTYSITVSDSKNCTATTEYEITGQEAVVANITAPDDPICFGNQVFITVDSASGGSGTNYRFSINNGPLVDISESIAVFAGTYSVKVFDQDGCSDEETITINQPDELQVDLGPDQEINLGEIGVLEALVDSGITIDSVFWNPIENLECLTQLCNQVSFSPNTNQKFEVFIKDINGCIASDDVNIIVNRSRNVYVPNAFRPLHAQNESNNEIRIYTGQGASLIEYFRIFDRWGNLIHQEENLTADNNGAGNWDGTFNGQILNPGVYVYVTKVQFIDGLVQTFKGNITLLR